MCFALFCIFVRNEVSVAASVAIIIVGIYGIAGFWMLLKPAMFSIYLYLDGIWFSVMISQAATMKKAIPLTHPFKSGTNFIVA